MTQNPLAEFIEQFCFNLQNFFFGTQNLLFILLQFGSNEPLCIHKGLLPDIGFGHFVLVCFGHFQVVTEHLIISHLQGLDACLFPFL